ncbi:MAG: SH3 domain-containing protein [Caldilineaceae bacterium]
MNPKTTSLIHGGKHQRRRNLSLWHLGLMLMLFAGISLPWQVSLAASSATPTATAVIISAVVGSQGASLWDQDGKLFEKLPAGALLTASHRSTDSQWLYVQNDSGKAGWVAVNTVITANLANLPAQTIQITPITPTVLPTPAPTATPVPTNAPAQTNGSKNVNKAAPVQVAVPASNGQPTVRIVTPGGSLNVRGGPGTSYPVIAQTKTGAEFHALGRNDAGDWVQIEIAGTPYNFGWVAARFVMADSALSDLPVANSTSNAPAAQAAQAAPSANSGPTGLRGKLVIQESWGGTIYLYDLNNGALRALTGGFDPALSPDGSKVVFTRIGGENGIYLINTDGSNEHKIFGERQGLFSPKFSPDGQWILFVRTDSYWKCRDISKDFGRYHCEPDAPWLSNYDLIKEYRPQLARIDVNGGNYRDIAALDTASSPDWTSSGIVYSSAAGIQATTDKAQNANRQVTFDEFKKYYMDPDWQPGPGGAPGRIVFQRREASHWEIFGVNPDGSGLVALTHPATALVNSQPSNVAPAWSPDGQHIVFLSNRTPENEAGAWHVWVMNADGSNQHPLPVNLPFQYNFVAEQMLDWAP